MTSPENKPKKPVSRGMRALMLGIPATVLLFSLVVLLRASLLGSQEGAALPPSAEPAAAASAPQAELSPAQPRGLRLKAFSSAADLYVVLSDPEGDTLPDASFSFTVVAPDGSLRSCPASAEGTLYLTQLEPGLYTVRLESDG